MVVTSVEDRTFHESLFVAKCSRWGVSIAVVRVVRVMNSNIGW